MHTTDRKGQGLALFLGACVLILVLGVRTGLAQTKGGVQTLEGWFNSADTLLKDIDQRIGAPGLGNMKSRYDENSRFRLYVNSARWLIVEGIRTPSEREKAIVRFNSLILEAAFTPTWRQEIDKKKGLYAKGPSLFNVDEVKKRLIPPDGEGVRYLAKIGAALDAVWDYWGAGSAPYAQCLSNSGTCTPTFRDSLMRRHHESREAMCDAMDAIVETPYQKVLIPYVAQPTIEIDSLENSLQHQR